MGRMWGADKLFLQLCTYIHYRRQLPVRRRWKRGWCAE